MRILTPLLFSLSLSACGSYGITAGGVQDIDFARELIADGMIPGEGDFTDEGLFSQHDLPIEGPDCFETLCPRTSAAWIDPVDGQGGEILMQLGFATDTDPAHFERRPLNLSIAVDTSGSMSGDSIDLSKKALHDVVDSLDKDDTMSLVRFSSKASVVQSPLTMDAGGRAKMHKAVDRLKAGGSTAMEAGLSLAYDQVKKTDAKARVEERVLLLTDAQPNVGGTGKDSFLGLARSNADHIGLTVFGVGLNLGADLMNDLATVRGANGFTFFDAHAMRRAIQTDFDLMVSPVAYDLDVVVTPAPGRDVSRSWGTAQDAGQDRVHIGASTLFLSREDGAIGISLVDEGLKPILQQAGPIELAHLELSWEPVGKGARVQREVDVSWDGGQAFQDDHTLADQEGVYRLAALVDEVLALEAGAAFCGGELELEEAEARIATAAERIQTRAGLTRSADLQVEADLMTTLLANVQAGGPCH